MKNTVSLHQSRCNWIVYPSERTQSSSLQIFVKLYETCFPVFYHSFHHSLTFPREILANAQKCLILHLPFIIANKQQKSNPSSFSFHLTLQWHRRSDCYGLMACPLECEMAVCTTYRPSKSTNYFPLITILLSFHAHREKTETSSRDRGRFSPTILVGN